MHKRFLIIGICFAGLAVALGAYGAHELKKIADAETVEVYKTAVQYQFYHALALMVLAYLAVHIPAKQLRWAGRSFIAGIVLFSGSLYSITLLKATNQIVPGYIGPVTPLGGLLFILGWGCLLYAVIKSK